MVEMVKSRKKVAMVAPIFKNPLSGGGFPRAPAGAPSFALLLLAH
jgi:hypothetical protein